MKKLVRYMMLSVTLLSLNCSVWAQERGTPEDAVAMVKKAVAYIQKHGQEKAFAAFADLANSDFPDREMYVYVNTMKGVTLISGVNPKLAGKDLIELKDADGIYINKISIDLINTQGKGWVNYRWPNPVTKVIENKSSYIEKVGDIYIGCGIYRR